MSSFGERGERHAIAVGQLVEGPHKCEQMRALMKQFDTAGSIADNVGLNL